MVGITRLYLEPTGHQPSWMKPDWIPAVMDFDDLATAEIMKKKYTLRGYSVVMVQL
jgi:hypothetical protein|tara:strand:+ start:302 stop:469 length:168 start_codon:yes stop_codon:yes gene_type:complete